jgi:hypothetical protein
MASNCDDRFAAKRPRVRLLAAALGACALWLLASCGHGSPGNAPTKPTLQSTTVSARGVTVTANQNQQHPAAANYLDSSLRPLSGAMQVVPIASEGQIPADFSLANGTLSLYGNFDASTQASVSDLPSGAEKNSFFERAKEMEVHPFFTGGTRDSGASRVFFGTYAGPLGEGFACHGCAPLIGMAAFVQTSSGWVVESRTKTALFSGQWGKPPEQASIARIGPEHVGVKLEGLCAFCRYVSILVPWKGEIREAFAEIVAEGNGQVCSDEDGDDGGDGMKPQPCVGTEKTLSFVKGANPDYDDIVLTLSGTTLSAKPPYKVVEVSGTERKMFSEGKYIPSH